MINYFIALKNYSILIYMGRSIPFHLIKEDTNGIFPNFVTYVKIVFDSSQKLFCLFSKALVTVAKNFRNFTSLCVNITKNTR